METISELSQLNFFALMGIMIFLIAIGLVLPSFIIRGHRKELNKKSWVVPETVTNKDSIIRNEKE